MNDADPRHVDYRVLQEMTGIEVQRHKGKQPMGSKGPLLYKPRERGTNPCILLLVILFGPVQESGFSMGRS